MSKATFLALAEMVTGDEIKTLRRMCKNGTDVADILDSLIETATKALAGADLDKCRMCHGIRGGAPGNENIVHGMTICDYCHSDIITVEREVRTETLKAAARIARMTKGGYTANVRVSQEEQELIPDLDGPWVLNSQIADRIESVILTVDERWQSLDAMRLWGQATNRDGERLHEQYDGNGGPRHDG